MNDKVKEAIIKKLTGDTDLKSEAIFSKWLSEGNEGIYNEYSKIWSRAAMINRSVEVDIDKPWQRVLDRKRSSWYSSVAFKVAASILLLLVSSLAIYHYQFDKKYNYEANQKIETVLLPDGTQITLNIGAFISYDKDFGNEYREVTLSGEAFFEVAKDSEKAFFVETEHGQVAVLGTSFNLSITDNNTRLNVVSGLVKMSNSDFSSSQLFQTGESGEINTGEVMRVTFNANSTSWLTGELVFDNAIGSDVITDISKFYNIEIELENDLIGNCRLTSSYKNKSLEEVLDELKLLWSVDYSVDGNVVTLSGAGCGVESRIR